MKKWAAKVRVGGRTFNAKATADSALGAKHKIASAALSAYPNKDIYVSEIKEAVESMGAFEALKNILNFK